MDVKERLTKLRSCVKVEVDVLGSPSLIQVIFLMVSVDVKLHLKKPRGWLKVEVNVLGSPDPKSP